MPARVAEEVERRQLGEAWEGVETDAVQFSGIVRRVSPVAHRHLATKPFLDRKQGPPRALSRDSLTRR
jgi:hypothetical protein